MKSLWRVMRSLRTAAVLIVLLAFVCVTATFIPQGRDEVFYLDRYGERFGSILLTLGMDRIFSSLLFLVPAAFFLVNLSSCAVWRLVRELRRVGRRRHGPDILHLGLILLAAGALVSGIGRQEGVVWLGSGDALTLPKGGSFELVAFETVLYEDGRPRSWTSRGVYRDIAGNEEAVAIAVNSPTRVEGLKLYQTAFRDRFSLILRPRPGTGAPERLEEGDVYADRLFAGIRLQTDGTWLAVLLDRGGNPEFVIPGARLGEAFVDQYEVEEITGIRAVKDPGVVIVFLSFVPLCFGLFFTFYEKRRTL